MFKKYNESVPKQVIDLFERIDSSVHVLRSKNYFYSK